MKLARADVLEIQAALARLSGREVLEKDSNGTAKFLVKPYAIDGKARYAIARNLNAYKRIAAEIDDERQALFAKHAGDQGEIGNASPEGIAFARDMKAYLAEEVDFDAHRFPVDALKIEDNQLDAGIVAALLPILEGEI